MGFVKSGCIAFAMLISIVAGCDKPATSSTSGSGAPAAAKTSGEPIRLVKFYVAQLGRNGNADVLEFENSSDKAIDAFKGQLLVYDKFGEVADTRDVEYTEVVAPNSKLYLYRMFIDDVLNTKKGYSTPEPLNSMAKELGVTVDKLEVQQKYAFKLTKAMQAK